MATKDERPNLLSKVALFVRNPTKDWAELDNPETLMQSGYDRSALKAAIERKRQNDFVRRREFDQLRKLRKSQANGEVVQMRPSVFQTSSVTDPDARALTLKKIDEIEAQMSKQWWKGKTDAHVNASTAETLPPQGDESATGVPSSTQTPATNFASTEPMPVAGTAEEFAATQVASGIAASAMPHTNAPRAAAPAGGGQSEAAVQGFSTSQLFASEAQDMATDPELEEAAIRFANADDAGAATVLLDALRSQPGQTDVALSWFGAVLDLYRATGNRVGFDQAVLEFSWRFPALHPAWSDFREEGVSSASLAQAQATLSRAADGAAMLWCSPSVLDSTAMEQLRSVLSTNPMPWRLDWSALERVDPSGQGLLQALFASLCAEPVSVEFAGADAVVQALRELTPTADRSVDHGLWVLRLDAMRAMQRQDDFELVALDYCVTFEVAPPPWMPAACQFVDLNAHVAGAPGTDIDLDIAPAAPQGSLHGVLSGDVTPSLVPLQGQGVRGGSVHVLCSGLLRVDFAAAGSILNWVAMQQSAGCAVQFVDVHRLVAAFFTVIGINEHARVIPRNI